MWIFCQFHPVKVFLMTNMQHIAGIMVGGALGALLRYLASSGVYAVMGKAFPYGTLLVNVLGSFLMGLLSVYLLQKMEQGSFWHLTLLVGFLGAFTTFSTFSMDSLNLFIQGHTFRAFLNIISNVCLCLLAAWLGIQLAKTLN